MNNSLCSKGLLWLSSLLAKSQKPINEERMDIAECVHGATKMATMGNQWIWERAAQTYDRFSTNQS